VSEYRLKHGAVLHHSHLSGDQSSSSDIPFIFFLIPRLRMKRKVLFLETNTHINRISKCNQTLSWRFTKRPFF